MPIARFQMPDGRVARFEVPEGTTPEQANALMSQALSGAASKPYDPTEDMGTGQKVLAGIGQGMSSAGRALLQGISKITGAEANGAGLIKQSEIDDAKSTDAALLKTGAGRVGSALGTAAVAAPTALIPGANTYMGASLIGGGTGLALTEGDLGDRAKGAAWGAAGGAAGKGLGDLLGWGVPKLAQSMAAKRTAAQAANAQKDAAAVAAKEAGYVIPPSDVNPSLLNEILGGLSGKIKTAQVASAKNQGTTNALARKALGVADDVPLTADTLAAIRKEAGKAYEAVRGAGTINADDAYMQALEKMAAKYEGAGKDFPGLAKSAVTDLVDSLKQPKFEASSAVDAIKVLRETSDKAFRSGDTSLGKAAKSAAGEMESLLDRHLQATGAPADLLKSFRDARQTIAKTYTVQKALNSETGDVSAQMLAGQLKKGKPLSGDLLDIAKIGSAFPKATQSLKEAPKAVSPLDFMAGLMGAGSTGPVGAAAVAARPAVRSLLLSKTYQDLLANPKSYAPSLLEQTLPAIDNGLLRSSLPFAGSLLGVQLGK